MTILLKPDTSETGLTKSLLRHKRQKRTWRRIPGGLVGFLMISVALLFFAPVSFAQGPSAGNTRTDEVYAADFVLKDLNGKEIKLSDYKGRPVFLIFMTTWCRDCFASIPTLKAIYKRYHEKGLVMININVGETHAKMAAYSQKNSIPYPTLLDPEGAVSKKYGVGGVPVKALIDRDGRIICWNCRSLEDLLEKQFETTAK